MKRMLVIGIGSLIMSDDGIGTRVAGAIKDKLQEHEIAILVGETDVQYCINEIRSDDFIVIIDAVMQGNEPGSIEIIPLQNTVKSHGKLHSQHDFSLIDAISLNYPGIQGCLIGIEAVDIGFGLNLSDVLKKRFDHICYQVFSAVIEMKEAATRA
jgi:hydrogenase maturation protease